MREDLNIGSSLLLMSPAVTAQRDGLLTDVVFWAIRPSNGNGIVANLMFAKVPIKTRLLTLAEADGRESLRII